MQKNIKTIFHGNKAYYCQTMIREVDYAET